MPAATEPSVNALASIPGSTFKLEIGEAAANYGSSYDHDLGGIKDLAGSRKSASASSEADNKPGKLRTKQWLEEVSIKGKLVELDFEHWAWLTHQDPDDAIDVVAMVPGSPGTDGTITFGEGDPGGLGDLAVKLTFINVNVSLNGVIYRDMVLELPRCTCTLEGDFPAGMKKAHDLGFSILGSYDETVTDTRHRHYRWTGVCPATPA